MKKMNMIIVPLLWGAIMAGGLAILDVSRGNPVNWFIALAAAVVIGVFKFMNMHALARAQQLADENMKAINERNNEEE